jgi:hypothetical protein
MNGPHGNHMRTAVQNWSTVAEGLSYCGRRKIWPCIRPERCAGFRSRQLRPAPALNRDAVLRDQLGHGPSVQVHSPVR